MLVTVAQINQLLRDYLSWDESNPLPVGDFRSGKHFPPRSVLRQLFAGIVSSFPEGDPGQVLGFGPEGGFVAVNPGGTDGQSVTITTVTSQAAFDAATPGPLEIIVRIA